MWKSDAFGLGGAKRLTKMKISPMKTTIQIILDR